MAMYKYKAKTLSGRVVYGECRAGSQRDVILFLQQKRYMPISIKKTYKNLLNFRRYFIYLPLSKSLALFFLLEVSSMLKSGMSFSEVMESMSTSSHVYRIRLLAQKIKYDLLHGLSLWEALSRHRFVLRNMIPDSVDGMGISGNISVLFEQTYNYHSTKRDVIRKIVLERMPQFFSLCTMFSLYVYFGYDWFSQYIRDIGYNRNITAPEFSVSVFKIISFIYFNWYLIVVAIFAIWVLSYLAYKISWLKFVFDSISLFLYPVSILIRGFQVNVFFNYLYLYLRWGDSSQKAIHKAGLMLSNSLMRKRCAVINDYLVSGLSLADAVYKSKLLIQSEQMIFAIPSREQLIVSLKKLINNQDLKLKITAAFLNQSLRVLLYVVMAFITIIFFEAWSLFRDAL